MTDKLPPRVVKLTARVYVPELKEWRTRRLRMTLALQPKTPPHIREQIEAWVCEWCKDMV